MSFKNSRTNSFNQMKTAYPDILWQASMGYNPELGYIHKFGRNSDVASGTWEDVWDLGGDYNWPSDSGEAMWASSSSAADTMTILVQGLDENFLRKEETVVLQGKTFVPLTGLWARVFRAYNTGSTDCAGVIYISSDNTDAGGDGIPDVTSAIHTTINAAANQTLQTIYTVPADCELYLVQSRANLLPVSGGTVKAAKFKMDIRAFGKVWRTQATAGLTTTGTSLTLNLSTIPRKVSGGSDIRVQAFGIGAAVDVDATFTGVLITV